MNGHSGDHPLVTLNRRAEAWGVDILSQSFALNMDKADPLGRFREQFCYPKKGKLPDVDYSLIDPEEDSVYFVGNSLGLQPKGARQTVERELEKWANWGVEGHTRGKLPWAECDLCVENQSAALVGAKKNEVAIMNGLTVNLHLLMISFYKPTETRFKIMLEKKAFPSDHYMVESQIRLHGLDPEKCMCLLEPREGEETLRHSDILRRIEEEGESIAVILVPGVQFYTGQLFDIAAITKAGHSMGCIVGVDLAHSVGNVELSLHDWNVDFASWCTYKYLNSGAGCIGGAFMHEKHNSKDRFKLLGWWGHRDETRFDMTNVMEECKGIRSFRLSNPSFMPCALLEASLQVFSQTSISELRQKSKLLTAYLEHLLLTQYPKPSGQQGDAEYVEIITPSDPNQRGCQLSVKFSQPVMEVFKELKKRGVLIDKREPDVIRVSPIPLYNSFHDVYRFVKILGEAMEASCKTTSNNGYESR